MKTPKGQIFPEHMICVAISLFMAQACPHELTKPENNTAGYQNKEEENELSAILKRPYCISGPHQTSLAPELAWRNQALIHEIYEQGLSKEKAVQIALVNNPELFAFYENLALGNAALVEAGLQENPIYSASNRVPNSPEYTLNQLFDMSISFLDYFLIPLREQAAIADIQVIEAQIAQKVLDLVKDVQISWLDVMALEEEIALENKRIELKEIAAGLAKLQEGAKNVSELNARSRLIQFNEAQQTLKTLASELESARERLNRLLGFFDNESCWHTVGKLDWKTDPSIPDIVSLEQSALANRPGLEASRREIVALAEEAKLKDPWTYSKLRVGTSSEREPEGFIVSGPSIELELPVFNFGQAEALKYTALIAQAQKRLVAQAVEACSEVREFFLNAHIFQDQLNEYEKKIIPDVAEQVSDAQSHYNAMTLGIYALLDIKEQELRAKIEAAQTLKNYLKTRVLLLHAAGGSFSVLGGNQ